MKSSKVQSFVLNSGGLSKVIMNNPDPQLIKPLGQTEDKLERDFYQPVGKKLQMKIENTGSETLWIVSGSKENFVVSPPIQPGTSETVTIKQDKEGRFTFGPFCLRDLSQGEDHVQVNLFDAQQAVNVVKINICRSGSKFEASMLLTDETQPQPLESSGTQHFREVERITKKDKLSWIVPNTIKAGPKLFSSILSAATGAPA